MFEFLEKYLMGPMAKISAWRPVRAIVAAGMANSVYYRRIYVPCLEHYPTSLSNSCLNINLGKLS